jgi:hypothetical protein
VSRLATLRDVVLERTPTGRDWWAVAWFGCLFGAALAAPPTGRPGGTGLVGKGKIVGTVLALVGPAALVGYRRASPVVAADVTWAFLVVGSFATGMWRLTVGRSNTWDLVMSALTIDTMPLAVITSATGYTVELAGWWLRRQVARQEFTRP